MNIKTMYKIAESTVRTNSPMILVGLSVAGVITTVVLAVKATPKALKIIEQKEIELFNEDKPLTKKEIIKNTWKCYAPTAIMGGMTIGCIIGANSIQQRRNAANASVYSITEAALKEYQAKVIETIGEKKEQDIRDKIAEDTITKNPVKNSEIFITGKGDTLCYDNISGRYFLSNIETLRKVQNDYNQSLLSDMWASLNELYYKMQLNGIDVGNDLGWNVDNLLEFEFSAQLTEDGRPCIVVGYKDLPFYPFR